MRFLDRILLIKIRIYHVQSRGKTSGSIFNKGIIKAFHNAHGRTLFSIRIRTRTLIADEDESLISNYPCIVV